MMSTSVHELSERIVQSARSIDLLAQFRSHELWSIKTEKTERMINLIGHHARAYFSPLRAVFLFEMKSFDFISYFSPILVRDGAMTLLYFFKNFPTPLNDQALLLIDIKHSDLIPISWRNQVLFYHYQKSNSISKYNSKKIDQLVFLTSAFGEKHCTLDYLKNILSSAQQYYDLSKLEVICCPLVSSNNLDLVATDVLIEHHCRLISEIQSATNNFATIKSLQKLECSNLSNTIFFDVNQYQFYYSDSFVSHRIQQLGGTPLTINDLPLDKKNVVANIPISVDREIKIYLPCGSQKSFKQAEFIQSQIDSFIQNPILSSEEKSHHSEELGTDAKICSSSFEDFAYNIITSTRSL